MFACFFSKPRCLKPFERMFRRDWTPKALKFWKNMKLEFMTHYRPAASGVLVIVKSRVSHRRSKWSKFMRLIRGSELELVKVKRYNSPIQALKGTPFEDEIHKNIFTPEPRDETPAPPAASESPKRVRKAAASDSPKKVRKAAASDSPKKVCRAPAPDSPKKVRKAPASDSPTKVRKARPRRSRTESDPILVRLLEREVAPGKVLPSETKRGVLHKAMEAVFGQEWSRGNCVDLRVLWLLEVHRRLLGLERFLASKGVGVWRLVAQRAQAFSAKRYVLLDPITLALPMLFGHLRGSFDVQADATYRLLAVAASIHPMLRYGMELTVVSRGHLSGSDLAEAAPFLFEWPFTFLPDGMRATLAASPVPNAAANIGRRVEKEQDDVQELVRTGRLPAKSPVLRMYRRMLRCAPELLAADTHDRALTRHLPPTPSLPDAVYDPVAFLAQMPPPPPHRPARPA